MSENTEVAIPSTSDIMSNSDMLNTVKDRAKSLGAKADEDLVIYIKMTKAGDWVHGEEEDEVDEETTYVVNPLSYQYGAVAFSDGKFMAEKLVSAFGNDPIPNPEELEETDPIDKIEQGDGWKSQHGIMLISTEGGSKMVYKSSSSGGIRALERLIGAVGERMDTNPEACFPVIELSSDSYKHKKYGKIFNPVLTLVAWAKNDSAEIVDEVEADD